MGEVSGLSTEEWGLGKRVLVRKWCHAKNHSPAFPVESNGCKKQWNDDDDDDDDDDDNNNDNNNNNN